MLVINNLKARIGDKEILKKNQFLNRIREWERFYRTYNTQSEREKIMNRHKKAVFDILIKWKIMNKKEVVLFQL